MSARIKLSKEHGVNPTIPVCFWCGKERNEIALLGAAYKGEAPRHMVLDYNACPDCESNMAKGITLIEALTSPLTPNQSEAAPGVYPTGRWWVVTEAAAKEVLNAETLAEVLKARKAFIAPQTAVELGLPTEDTV